MAPHSSGCSGVAGGRPLIQHEGHLCLAEQFVAGHEVDLLGESQGPIRTHQSGFIGGLLPLIDHADERDNC